MAFTLWSQDIFTKGEISPLMYARVSVTPYYNGLKTAKNVICFPQGAAGKRFGTYFRAILPTVNSANDIYFQSMQYLNECVYLIVVIPTQILIYLEGTLIFTLTGTVITENVIRLIDHTVLDNIFRMTTGILPPLDLTRSPSTQGTLVVTVNGTTMTLTGGANYAAGNIVPVRFQFQTALFTSTPQVLTNKTYFLFILPGGTTANLYNTATDAAAQINAFVFTGAGIGTQYFTVLNNWQLNPTTFVNLPTFDFTQNYFAATFTLFATSGNGVTLTCSQPVFGGVGSPFLYAGGTFSSELGGLARITNSVNNNTVLVNIINTFTSTSLIGSQSLLTSPVWSNTRGWPRVCSSFQNRAFFANTDVLPNGLWGSVINDYDDFDDSQTDSDNAISWYPTSDDINFIRFIVPYRSLTIHTNSGVFSTPLSVETAITPLNFSLTIQDSTPAEAVQPRGIDNQIVILSGNDAHSLLWDGFNNAYQSNIISIANEQLIRDPVDEAAFVDLTRAGSRYMLIVNQDGTLAIYQTLISEEVQGFTPAYLEQPYGNAYFRWVSTSNDGRGWFVTERQLPTAGTPNQILGYTSTTFNATGSNFSTIQPTPVQFTTSDVMPVTTPQIVVNTFYWVIGTDANDFIVYSDYEDALILSNPIMISSAGVNASVIPYPLTTYFMIEELDFDAKTDCTLVYSGTATSSLPDSNGLFDAEFVQIQGDGYGFDAIGNSGISVEAHGTQVTVSNAQYGFPLNVEIEPLQLSIYGTSTKQSNIVSPKMIRDLQCMFADTIGGEVNGIPIAMQSFTEVDFGTPPQPVNGIFELSIMKAWDDFQDIGIYITHSAPFDFKLIGLFYKVEI